MGSGLQIISRQGIQMEDQPCDHLLCMEALQGQLPLGSHFSPTQDCPLCGDQKDTGHLLEHCMTLNIRTRPNPIEKLLTATSEADAIQTATSLWCAWKVRCWVKHRIRGQHMDILKLYRDFMSQEIERRNVAFG